VVAALEDVLADQYLPVVVYCMRKSGKTSTARLLQLVDEERVVDLSQHLNASTQDPYIPLRYLRNMEPLAHRAGVLVLDEFDYFARWLADQPEAVAMAYLTWLREAAQHSRVLCLGLDPYPFRTLYPASNPLQQLREFTLPYFSHEECGALCRKMGGPLKQDDDLVEWLWRQSGGHPGVLRGLMRWYMASRFGSKAQRIPTRDPLRLEDVNPDRLRSDAAHAQRVDILGTILNTRGSNVPGTLKDAWKIMEHVVVHEPAVTTRQAIEDQLSVTDLGLLEHSSFGLALLFSWGLIRESAEGEVRVSIPLLRLHLRQTQRLPNDDPSL
jgi:hypothetical protein